VFVISKKYIPSVTIPTSCPLPLDIKLYKGGGDPNSPSQYSYIEQLKPAWFKLIENKVVSLKSKPNQVLAPASSDVSNVKSFQS
tara:strand:+ start:341 stop:592 length:252 start_codon:yes stop_codon:yes gene_type:complete